MGKIEAPKRIRVEDYDGEDRNLVGKLAGSINDFMENVYQTLVNNVDFENLAQSVVTVEVNRDSSALPASSLTQPVVVKTNLSRKIIGISCIAAFRLDNISSTPESQPFITFTTNGVGNVTITKVTGLQANSKYQLRLLLIT